MCMQNHKQRHNKDERLSLLEKIYLSLYWKGCGWEGVGDRTELQHTDPHSYGHQRFFPVLLGCSTGGHSFNPSTVKVIFWYSLSGCTCYLHRCISYFDSPAESKVNIQHSYIKSGRNILDNTECWYIHTLKCPAKPNLSNLDNQINP